LEPELQEKSVGQPATECTLNKNWCSAKINCSLLCYLSINVQMMIQSKYRIILILMLLLAAGNSCKNDSNSIIPYVIVEMNINPTNYIELNIPGGAAYFRNEGFGGVLIVNNWGDELSPYLAFDAACTNEVSSSVRVEAQNDGTAICPKCGSKFMIFGSAGMPLKGPARHPLKQYRALSSNGRIIVTN
jgi:Rieske Fe-S protein